MRFKLVNIFKGLELGKHYLTACWNKSESRKLILDGNVREYPSDLKVGMEFFDKT